MEECFDHFGGDENHPVFALVDLVADRIGEYENRVHPYPAKPLEGWEMLAFLLEQHGLKQADLADELGAQSVVSEVLSGKRKINLRQAKALATRFGVGLEMFA